MVTSWSSGKQDILDLFVQTRHGLTEKLQARAALEGTAFFTAFVSGPYGRSEPVGEYKSILAVASGFGIASVIPYIKQLLYGYNTSSVRVRRVHLVWQVQTMDIAVAAEPLLNSLLDDNVLDDGYILEMSFYVEYKSKARKGRPFRDHHWATIYNGFPDYNSIISTEASGEHIERVSNSQEERGKLDKEIIEWILQRDPHTVGYKDKENQTPVKEEASGGKPLICDMQDQSPPETTHTTTRKRSCSPSSSPANNVGISLKGASAPSKVEKKIPKKSRAILKALKKANLGSVGVRIPSNGSEIMLDLNLPTLAIGAATPVFVCGIEEEAVTLIQSLYKTTVGEPLDAAHAQTVKTAASSPLCIGVAEFAKSIMDSLKINEYKECSF
ncbi:metalloreductase, putative [Aspergillus udagawae]|uniref:Metalloreductase, putative n=1 Tax=Aspergillus udagawae TaxID=91492 RepID=A0ABQ1BFE0_9EURO|nr:metalloreductase, putative [Aspergillus udagawae]